MSTFSNKKEAILILSSGGARGITQIGVIEELEEQGWSIKAVAGCSIGSVIGGFYSAGKLAELKKWMLDIDKMDVIRYFDVSFSPKGFIKGDKVLKDMRKILGNVQIEDLPIPYKALSADILTHQPVWFDKGDLYDAIRSSISIPGIFTPNEINNQLLVDGAIANPLPLDAFPQKTNQKIIAVNLNARIDYSPLPHEKPDQKEEERLANLFEYWKTSFKKITGRDKQDKHIKKPGVYGILINSFEMLQEMYTETIIEKYEPSIVIDISRSCADTFAFHHASTLIEYGRKQAQNTLSQL